MPQSHKNPLHIGLRTTKTAVSAFICLVLFRLSHRGSPLYAVLSAVFSLRTDTNESIQYGLSRILGNTVGGILAILMIEFQRSVYFHPYQEFLFIPLGIVVLILFSNNFNPPGVVNSTATFLVIYYTIDPGHNMTYAINRVLDTLIGALIAMIVNRLLPSPHLKKDSPGH